jgi:hypothetical protein
VLFNFSSCAGFRNLRHPRSQVTDALAIYYLYALGQDWSVWISTAVDLTMVTLLVLIVVYYETCGAPAKVRRSQQHGHADSAGGGDADAYSADGGGRSGTLRGGRASADEHGANSEVRRLLAGESGRVGSVSTSFAGGKEPISIDSTL